ncbi:hypothetical protein E8E14_001757 [Neopestalotiopsis sp. 37M]|nr:hypothetical protein E8E14_001757 [Neopestalotiopsis sp. 37M]
MIQYITSIIGGRDPVIMTPGSSSSSRRRTTTITRIMYLMAHTITLRTHHHLQLLQVLGHLQDLLRCMNIRFHTLHRDMEITSMAAATLINILIVIRTLT